MTLEEARTAAGRIELLENAVKQLVHWGGHYMMHADALIGYESDPNSTEIGFQIRMTAALCQGLDALDGNPEPTRDHIEPGDCDVLTPAADRPAEAEEDAP